MPVCRILDEIATNCSDITQKRTHDLKDSLPDMQQEWRRVKASLPARVPPHHSQPHRTPVAESTLGPGQDEFSRSKQRLLDKETKKRMLEEVWQDKIELEPEEQQQADRELQLKKEAVTRTKKANQQRRDQVQETARTIERAVLELHEREDTLRSQLRETEEAQVVAEARRIKEAEQAAAVGQARQTLSGMDEKMRAASTESDTLRERLKELQARCAEAQQRMQISAEQCTTVKRELDETNRQAEAQSTEQSERSAWYQQVRVPLNRKRLTWLSTTQRH